MSEKTLPFLNGVSVGVVLTLTVFLVVGFSLGSV